MGYQALLFCPDEKLARVVSQVFSELDFAVEPVHEPFAAVKKLMAQRYDAIVVDCENEQNASLLFRSARNSRSNQNSLAIALVEGQAGVAKAYRIGANLVLTKPINVEQAKGTLRVARGLLRKNSEAAGAGAASAVALEMPAITTPVSAGSSLPATRGAVAAAPLQAAIPADIPAMAATAEVEDQPAAVPAPAAQTQITIAAEEAEEAQPASADAIENGLVKNDEGKNQAARIAAAALLARNASSAFTPAPGSAAAPAPAREVTAPPARANKTVEPEPANPSHDAVPIPTVSSVSATDAPSFAALGEGSSGVSGSRKILIAAVAILALAALGYLGYGMLGKSSLSPTPQPESTPQGSGQQHAPAPRPISSPVAAPSTTTPDQASSATQTLAPQTTVAASRGKPSAGAGDPPAVRIAANVAANSDPEAKKQVAAPILVKSNAAGAKTQAHADEPTPLPSPLAVASANDANLSGLMSSASSNPPRPSLATVRVSQGVSQPLLIKRVQPTYSPAARGIHAEGTVQIEATINKEGNVINPRVLRGDPVLAHAAVEAVRQWRYKPYYLDGEPIEIQTQVTVNFKAN